MRVTPRQDGFVISGGPDQDQIYHSVCRFGRAQGQADIAVADAPRDADVRHLGTFAGGVFSVTKAMPELLSARL